MESEIYYTFYKTTNNKNGKYYFGVHKTKDLDDGYLGSGVGLKRAIKKYGKESFTKIIVKFFENEADMYEYERSMVTEEVVSDSKCYNSTLGGIGGFSHIDNSGENSNMKNRETVEKIVENRRKNGTYHTEKCVVARKLATEKAANLCRGTKRPQQSEITTKTWNKLWETKREDILKKLRSYFLVISPEGNFYITNTLQEFCESRNLTYVSVWSTSKNGLFVKRGKAKGWRCILVEKGHILYES